jgi:ribonuclease VapC
MSGARIANVSNRFVLDTSALLTYIEDEPGANRVWDILKNESVIIPWPALMELFYITTREKSLEEAELRLAALKHGRAEILWEIDETTMLIAAKIKAAHQVSFADAVISGIAIRQNSTLVHKDPEFAPLGGKVAMEILPYKK